MNIGIFTDTFYPQVSGVGTSIATLRNQLERMGHTVYIFTTTDPKIEKKFMKEIRFVLRAFHLFLLPIGELQFADCFRHMRSQKN